MRINNTATLKNSEMSYFLNLARIIPDIFQAWVCEWVSS